MSKFPVLVQRPIQTIQKRSRILKQNGVDSYISHDIWFTNKVHVIIDHVPQAIERTGKGLLGNSEQVVEATHAKFEKFWSKYVVVDLESDVHGERLLQCVIDFNSSNI